MDTPSENLAKYFPEVISWMANAIKTGGTVFVHW
jgi:protein-tyrosine phosphatase